LKLQVLALRRALFRVARQAVKRGADEENVSSHIDAAIGDAGAAGEPQAADVDDAKPPAAPQAADGAAESALDRYRERLGVAAGAAGRDSDDTGDEAQATEGDGAGPDTGDAVLMPPAAERSASTSSVATVAGDKVGSPHPERSDGTGAAVSFLGLLLSPPIMIADALAAASEAVFGASDDADEYYEDEDGAAEVEPEAA